MRQLVLGFVLGLVTATAGLAAPRGLWTRKAERCTKQVPGGLLNMSTGELRLITPLQQAANTLNRQFTIERANRVWAGDITYIRTAEGWLYLAVVLDLYSRRVIAWGDGQPPHPGLGDRRTHHGRGTPTASWRRAASHRPWVSGCRHHVPRVAG